MGPLKLWLYPSPTQCFPLITNMKSDFWYHIWILRYMQITIMGIFEAHFWGIFGAFQKICAMYLFILYCFCEPKMCHTCLRGLFRDPFGFPFAVSRLGPKLGSWRAWYQSTRFINDPQKSNTLHRVESCSWLWSATQLWIGGYETF